MSRALAALVLLALVPLAQAAPEQVHLGLRDADVHAGLVVQWIENDPNAPATLTIEGPGVNATLEGERVLGPTPGLVYEARLPRLAPDATYRYRLGLSEYVLTSPPAPGNATRIAALGDMGTTRAAGNTVKALQAEGPGLVLHLGDVSYAGGDPLTWKAWFDLVEPVASTTLWLPALGNHEGDVQGIALDEAAIVDPSEQAVFTQRFPRPAETFWYSFDWGLVHVVVLDTFSEVRMPEAERAWLEADLAAPRDTPWTIAILHEPPYSSNAAHGSSPRAYDAFASILEEGGVDLVLAGHDHSYERTHPMRGGAVVLRSNVTNQSEGTIYIVTGGGGASLYEEFISPQPDWSATREALHHVLLLDATTERLEGRVVATDGSGYQDEFVIVRSAGTPTGASTAAIPLPAIVALAAAFAAFGLARRR